MECAKVRVDFGDEVSWAEHIEENVYRSLNNTFSNVPLLWFRYRPERPQVRRVCSLSQARTALAALLQLSDGALDKAKQTLQGAL